ncbi:molybdenum cofactor guanylyltransferase [Bacillus suaedaesalsae]|uniref:Probable molybdenum cofactor guanylyltransferase n=1 Tax=Bacillus suaedaesalsae TaxID=2810349 RepID=A0ABS2DLH1_9BACI|nr:molybdenum cofactor guanylyltransferase [Bacillus suaedaesalsae]MBM6619344.1 molybdenum cofactor guanylyltransferase [Bacillus suaedaesalsae]
MDFICGVILSGGESRRFGKPKAFELYKGIPFWEYSLQALKNVTHQQIVVSHVNLIRKFEESIDDSTQLVVDEEWVRGKGPMAGLYSAMKHVKAEWYVLLSCDIPKINETTISHLLSLRKQGDEAIIPVINDRVQPLIALYHKSVFTKLENQLLEHNLKMMSLLEKINVRYVSAELNSEMESFQNINDGNDLNNLYKK